MLNLQWIYEPTKSRAQFKDITYIKMANLLANLATCARRKVGCIIVDNNGKVMSTGYNGVAKGIQHCTNHNKCPGANFKSGSGLDLCSAIHAEQNALLQCRNVNSIHTIYTTSSPCMHCAKLIANTSCKRIVFIDKYGNEPLEYLSNIGIELIEIVLDPILES